MFGNRKKKCLAHSTCLQFNFTKILAEDKREGLAVLGKGFLTLYEIEVHSYFYFIVYYIVHFSYIVFFYLY